MSNGQGKQEEPRRSESDSIGDRELERRLTALESDQENLKGKVDPIGRSVDEIKTKVTTIETGMITKTQLLFTVLALIATLVGHLIIKHFKLVS